MSYAYLLIAIVAEVVATTALRTTNGFTRLTPSLVVVAGYAVAFVFLALTLRTIPVGIAYAIWSGVGVALITLAAYFVYGQRLDLPAMLGIGLVVAGVLMIHLYSRSTAH